MGTGRFAPSPTGDLHLGNLRTAIAAHASARAAGGRFLVRFEDLDRVTSSRDIAARQLRDLAELGVTWDEEPVFQSERFALSEAALDDLMHRDLVYPCFCSRREVREAAAAPHDGARRYPGTCRDLNEGDRRRRSAERPPALRLRTAGETVGFTDLMLGRVEGTVDDIVLRRNDGVPSYHLAVVVDDADQGVTEVVRGDDLAPVTPSHIHLQGLLGLPTPEYRHVPLMRGPDGERLAKRHGAVTLAELRAEGTDPSLVIVSLRADVEAWMHHE
jgi:glutamyl-tRNA synthetase